MKCPKCGIEVEDGMKFCGECGAKLPQSKTCPKCGAIAAATAKFCGECGYNFVTGGAAAPIMGDKNVIAGDVITNTTNNTTNNYNNTTNNYVCKDVIGEKKVRAEDEYRGKLEEVLADGVVDASEYDELERLRRKLDISEARAKELLEQQKGLKVSTDESLTEIERRQYESAVDILYGDGDFSGAIKRIKALHQNHPLNEEVLSIWLTAQRHVDREKTKTLIDSLPVDIPCAYLILFDIEIRKKDFAGAESKLVAAEKKWPDNFYVKCRRVEFFIALAFQSRNRDDLVKAMDSLQALRSFRCNCERRPCFHYMRRSASLYLLP